MRFIAFDLETTGIFPGVDQVTEIAAVRFEGGEVSEMFVTLVDPGVKIPEEAQKVSGITDEMVQGKPKIEDLLGPFAEFCQGDTMVAHNASFDHQFLIHDIQKYETPAPRGFVLDTLAMSKKIIPGLMNYRLGTVVQHMGIETDIFHRAEADSTYCGRLFYKLIQKMTVNGQPPEIETLVQLCGKPLVFPQIEKQPKQLNLLDF